MHQEEENVSMSDVADGPAADAKLVPVTEAIKYRRRAQQAEERLTQIEGQLKEARQQLQSRVDEIAQAEAQRDEARQQIQASHNRLMAERALNQAGVVDLEAAMLLLGKRLDLQDEVEEESISRSIQELLLDKPFLCHASGPMPSATASARQNSAKPAAQLAQAADRAARSGQRRDVADYLRLRRQATASTRAAR